MKKVITLTKTLTFAILLLVFAGASAANPKNDDTTKCKKRCCKHKSAGKETDQAIKEANESLKDLTLQFKAFATSTVNTEFTQAFAIAPIRIIRNGDRFLFIQAPEPVKEIEASNQKIDFSNLNKEMNNVQENMSQMDPSLKKDDAKTRKAAEELLKTGIKS